MTDKQNKGGDKRGVPVGDSAGRVIKQDKGGRSSREGRFNQDNRGYVVSQQQPVTTPKRPPPK